MLGTALIFGSKQHQSVEQSGTLLGIPVALVTLKQPAANSTLRLAPNLERFKALISYDPTALPVLTGEGAAHPSMWRVNGRVLSVRRFRAGGMDGVTAATEADKG